MAQTKAVATQQKALVKWRGEQIIVTFNDVKDLICRMATDQEAVVFLKTCSSLQLNPFADEIYLIKYDERDKAATVISVGSYHKAAEANKDYNGYEAGIILRDSGGKLEFREGAFLLDEEMDKLVGGWAKAYRKNRDRPTYIAVNKAECIRYTKEGRPTRFWTKEKQPSMLRKTALKRALVEAFPSLFAGTMSSAEVSEPVEAEYEEMAEGEVPPAMEKGGQPDWKIFWARVKSELGLTTEQARELLEVDSIKDELVDAGWAMEDIWNKLVSSLQQQKPAKKEPEQVVDVQTGEIITPPDDLEKELFGEAEEVGVAAPEEAEKKQPTSTAAPAKLKRDQDAPPNPSPIDPRDFKSWSQVADAAAKLGIYPSAVFKYSGYKNWEAFPSYVDAWGVVMELVKERKENPPML